MSTRYSGQIVVDGLVLALDASSPRSYPGSGTTWSNLVGTEEFTLSGSSPPTHISSSIKYFDYGSAPSGTSTAIYTATAPSNWNPGADGAFSFGGWVNVENSGSFNQFISIAGSFYFYLIPTIDGVRIYYTPTTARDFSSVGIEYQQWAYWFCVADRPNNTVYLYKNGILVDSASSLTATGSMGSGISYIGDELVGGEKLNGKVGAVQYYTKALSATEVLQNYNATKGRFL